MHPHDTTFRIYALSDPRNGEVCYVGLTTYELLDRLALHFKEARYGSPRPVLDWLNELQSLGLSPEIELLEQTIHPWRERHWIGLFRSHRHPLLNRNGGAATHNLKRAPVVFRECLFCGKPFERLARLCRNGNGKYCSLPCANKAHAQCVRPDPPVADRFWANIQKTPTCWIWTGTKDQHGYGQMSVHSHRVKAHRLSWEMHHGPIPTGKGVLHNCPDGDNPSCVNPAHLWVGDQKENTNDMVAKGRWSGGLRPRGANHGMARLTEPQVVEIRARRAAGGVTRQQLADEYGVSQSLIKQIIARKIWTHI